MIYYIVLNTVYYFICIGGNILMDDPGSPMAIILVFVLVLINAFFAMSEIAVISLNDAKLRRDAEEAAEKQKCWQNFLMNRTIFLQPFRLP